MCPSSRRNSAGEPFTCAGCSADRAEVAQPGGQRFGDRLGADDRRERGLHDSTTVLVDGGISGAYVTRL